MKQFLLSLFVLSAGFLSQAQSTQYWPYSFAYPKCNTMSAPTTNCTKVALGGDWEVAGTWSPAGIPKTDDIVCIPAGITVNVKGATYKSSTTYPALANSVDSPRLQIFVCGTIQFENSGKLSLAPFSFIQVYSGGQIAPPSTGSGSSDLIQIGGHIVWGGPGTGNQPPVNGPYVLSWPYIGAGVLPVAFDYFKAEQKQPYTVRLEWATLIENNNSSFIIERSADQKIWTEIGNIASQGNSNSRKIYSHLDLQPVNGYNYYRLKQVDIDGQITYSQIVRFNNLVRKNLSVFPNPVNSTAQLYSKVNFNQGQSIQLIDARGSRVRTINANGSNSMQIDMTSSVSGLYLLQLVENGRVIESVSVFKQ